MIRSILVLTALVLLAGCGRAAPKPEGPARDAFINAYVGLRQASVKATSARDFEQRRDSILRLYGVTDSSMKAFVAAHANDVSYMNKVWQEIGARVMADRTAPVPKATTPDRDTLIRGARPPHGDSAARKDTTA